MPLLASRLRSLLVVASALLGGRDTSQVRPMVQRSLGRGGEVDAGPCRAWQDRAEEDDPG